MKPTSWSFHDSVVSYKVTDGVLLADFCLFLIDDLHFLHHKLVVVSVLLAGI